MMKLSKYEKETIFLTSEGDNVYDIYTFNPALKRKLAEYSRKYPQCCKLKATTAEGSATYLIDKDRVSIRFLPPVSEERRQEARERRKKNGLNGAN